ncbi:MAG: hypothetical protein MUP13_09375, partial [Thermoanaerobaculales bacterium]|nr:hypothetical protein [Thermoanaerobaculales bacterium]
MTKMAMHGMGISNAGRPIIRPGELPESAWYPKIPEYTIRIGRDLDNSPIDGVVVVRLEESRSRTEKE